MSKIPEIIIDGTTYQIVPNLLPDNKFWPCHGYKRGALMKKNEFYAISDGYGSISRRTGLFDNKKTAKNIASIQRPSAGKVVKVRVEIIEDVR